MPLLETHGPGGDLPLAFRIGEPIADAELVREDRERRLPNVSAVAPPLVHPARPPDLLLLAECLDQRQLHHPTHFAIPAHLADRSDKALDPERGMPQGAVGHWIT